MKSHFHKIGIMFYIIFLLIISDINCYSSTKSDDLNDDIYIIVSALVTSDSLGVKVKNNDGIIASYQIQSAHYISNLFYDRYTDLISFEVCSTKTLNPERWDFELVIWDYKIGNSRILSKGESYDGEGLQTSRIYNYDWNTSEGIVFTYGWEWQYLRLINDGKFSPMPNFPRISYPKILGVLDNKEIILEGYESEESSNALYFKYDYKNGSITKFNSAEALVYNDTILSSTGENLNPNYRGVDRPRDVSLITWNKNGDAVAYRTYIYNEKRYEFIIQDLVNKKKYTFDTNNIICVIWRN